MTGPRIGSLFSGYGGLDSGVRSVIGGTVAWHCEYDTAPSKILAHHWPDVPNLGDITAVDWAQVPPVDVLTGGFPCQDLSTAGKRLGLRPGTRSGLWQHMAYAIAQLHPRLVVIENVRGILSAEAHSNMERGCWCVGDEREPTLRALGAVLGDLADLGYDAQWGSVRASDAGAPHRRERLFIAAHPAGERLEGPEPVRVGVAVGQRPGDGDGQPPAHADEQGLEGRRPVGRTDERPAGPGGVGPLVSAGPDISAAWGPYAAAVLRWEMVTGRLAPPPTEPSNDGRPRLSARAVEWMMGLPAGHVTDPAIGLTRTQQLKALGNGVVPQQCAMALRMLLGVPSQPANVNDAPLLGTPTAQLLPTPAVNDMGAGKSPEQWDEWTAKMQAEHGNGNGHGKSLAVEALRMGATP